MSRAGELLESLHEKKEDTRLADTANFKVFSQNAKRLAKAAEKGDVKDYVSLLGSILTNVETSLDAVGALFDGEDSKVARELDSASTTVSKAADQVDKISL